MKHYLVKLGLWLINTFGTEYGVTYSIVPGQVRKSTKGYPVTPSAIKRKAIKAFLEDKKNNHLNYLLKETT